MGGCVSSVHKNNQQQQEADPSGMKLSSISFGSKNDDNLLIPQSPVKPIVSSDLPISGVALKSQWSPSQPLTTFRDFGTREETFFDSQAWLDSDCDDDFLSVNGDFTPSRGSTPVHHNFSTNNRARFEDPIPDSKPEPSPTEKKKRLSELFRESLRENQEQDVDDQNVPSHQNAVNGNMEGKVTILDLPPKSSNGAPFVSGATSVCSSEITTPSGYLRAEKEKSLKSAQCCLPSLLSSRSFNERRKKRSPTQSIG